MTLWNCLSSSIPLGINSISITSDFHVIGLSLGNCCVKVQTWAHVALNWILLKYKIMWWVQHCLCPLRLSNCAKSCFNFTFKLQGYLLSFKPVYCQFTQMSQYVFSDYLDHTFKLLSMLIVLGLQLWITKMLIVLGLQLWITKNVCNSKYNHLKFKYWNFEKMLWILLKLW